MAAQVTTRRAVIRRNEALENLKQGSHGRSGEIISYSHYDTYTVTAGVATYKFFSVPLNQAAKTYADTNNLLAGVMPSSQRMTVDMIKIQTLLAVTDGMTDAILDQLYEACFNTTLKIDIPGKDNLGRFCLSELLNMSVMSAFDVTTLPHGVQYLVSGKHRLNIPIILAANSTYGVDLDHHTAAVHTSGGDLIGLKIKLILSGTLERLS